MTSTFLNRLGYGLRKEQFPADVLQRYKKLACRTPYIPDEFTFVRPKPIPAYQESTNNLYLPRFLGMKLLGTPGEIKWTDGVEIHVPFHGEMKEHQRIPSQKSFEQLNQENGGGGLLSLPCGFGKTAIACWLISQIKRKTFVLVHKEFLLNQWIERIGFFLPEAKVGRIQGKIFDIEGKDIVIGMIQTMSQQEFGTHAFDSFGLCILDEAHRVPCKEFSKALRKVQCPRMLALSATPIRTDGMHEFLKWFIGETIYEVKASATAESVVRRVEYGSSNPDYCGDIRMAFDKVNRSALLNQICAYPDRTVKIIQMIQELIVKEERVVLVLSDRRELLKEIHDTLKDLEITVGYYVGGMKVAELEESAKKDCILATFPMAAEGLDLARIDTVFLATPKSAIEQAVGRIRPVAPGMEAQRKTPLVIDWVDPVSVFESQARKRKDFFRKKKYVIEEWVWQEGMIHATKLEGKPKSVSIEQSHNDDDMKHLVGTH